MRRLAEMKGVREYGEGEPVELFYDETSGRMIIRATNECGNNETLVDLDDILAWIGTNGRPNILSIKK